MDEGRCTAIGLSDISLDQTKEIFEAARIKPAVVHVEAASVILLQCRLSDYWQSKWHRAASVRRSWEHSSEPICWRLPVITAIAKRRSTRARIKLRLVAWAIPAARP